MICKKCNSKNEKDSIYCQNCGAKLEEEKKEVQPVEKKETTTVSTNIESDETRKKNASTLCAISLILMYGFPIIMGVIAGVVGTLNSSVLDIMYNVIGSFSSLSSIAAIVLMIVARVKYPESKFAKVLMIVYIVQAAIFIILGIIFFFACTALFASCASSYLIF